MTSRPATVSDIVAAPVKSIVALTRDLIAIPSRAGEDSCEPMIDHVASWLTTHGIPVSVLDSDAGSPVALVAQVNGAVPGPTYCLNACLDTAPFGELTAWNAAPTEPRVEDGWLYGRGAADCKIAVAIFSHLVAEFQRRRSSLRGRLLVLFDAEEHTGRFGGVKSFLRQYRDIDGVMIGYPGNHGIIAGARGFYRATVTIHASGGHSGGRRNGSHNAIEKATQLVQALGATPLPQPTTDAFPLAPSLTVTGIRGGTSFSMIPDRCDIDVDIRLTPAFDADAARALLHATIRPVDTMATGGAPSSVRDAESWPSYRLADQAPIVQALLAAARAQYRPDIATVVCGPSNIGNYLAAHQIDATCGFGVTYANLHAPNERIKLDTIEMTYCVYSTAVQSLLTPTRGATTPNAAA